MTFSRSAFLPKVEITKSAFLGLQVGDPVGAGHRQQLDLHAHLGGDVVGHVDVQALRFEVDADKAIRRKVCRDGDFDQLGFLNVVQRRLGVTGTGQSQEAGGHGGGQDKAF